MVGLYKFIDGFNNRVGNAISWLTLFLVVMQLAVVLMRYVFALNAVPIPFTDISWSSVIFQESLVYAHGFLFTTAAAYTLLHNGHVRVDIFYGSASERTKDWTDLLGSLFFLIPVCILMIWMSWDMVHDNWVRAERSTEPLGIPYRYILRTTLIIMPVLLIMQGVSTIIKCSLRLQGEWVDDPYRNEESLD